MLARLTARQGLWIACGAIAVIWYPVLISLLGYPPTSRFSFGQAFNSMAEHLLAGRFDVDPDAIAGEGFTVGDQTMSYFGIFCALLRVPLVLTGYARTDITWWSCMAATWLGVLFQVRAIALVWPASSPPRQRWLAVALLIGVVLGGQHMQFLRPSIYQETIDWAFAQAAAFIFLAIRGCVTPRGFDRSTLCLMACCAGLALLTRVSFGIGLYVSFGLLLPARGRPRTWIAPAAILLAFVGIAGVVNMGRWGNPFTFADFTRFNLSQDYYPDRLTRLAAYGNFNPQRIWLGLSYYFLPIWVWVRADGHVLFAETQARLMDSMELPPGSFFVTDAVLLALAAVGAASVRDRIRAALLVGLCVQPVLMLCAISMAHRYRMEFYPLFFTAALFAVAGGSAGRAPSRSFRVWLGVGVIAGVVAAHGMAVFSAGAPFGPGDRYIERQAAAGAVTGKSWRASLILHPPRP